MDRRRAGALFVSCLLAAAGAQAAEVYRWTDAQGRVFYGDRAPEGQRASAKVVDIEEAPPFNAKSSSRPAPRPRPTASAARPEPAGQTAPAIIGRGQALPSLADRDARCEAAWQRFEESSACFAPFRMGGGKVRPEAYAQCENVMMPSDCGVPPQPGQ